MSNHQIVLGLNFGHGDSSAALIVDGELVAAAEEERFSRIKHDASYPVHSVNFCLKYAAINPEKVTDVALPGKPHWSWPFLLKNAVFHPIPMAQKIIANVDKRRGDPFAQFIAEIGAVNARIHRVEHHRAHLMSITPLLGPESATMVSLDGMGDGVSVALGRWSNERVAISRRKHYPDSLGYFYTALTQYLGFLNYGDEFKVMGLSSMGKPQFIDAMRRLIPSDGKRIFSLNRKVFPLVLGTKILEVKDSRPFVKNLYDLTEMRRVLGVEPRRHGSPILSEHADLAASLQLRFEEVANQVLAAATIEYPTETIGLSGGCSHNSVWVGKIPQNSSFSRVFVAPASGDAGLAVGAAVDVAKQKIKVKSKHPALLGPDSRDVPAQKFNPNDGRFHVSNIESEQQLVSWMVDQLCQEKIIGIFRGRMEFGPRALGARSIICDPRSLSMRDQLNARVKHREAFRPFAAFVMEEHQNEWLEASFYAPTMEAVFKVKQEKRNEIPAIVHYDDSCRIQSVRKDIQPFIWALLEAFYLKTGVPLLINTSFNDSEPVVCTEDDALSCFLNCEMDFIVFDDRIIGKLSFKD